MEKLLVKLDEDAFTVHTDCECECVCVRACTRAQIGRHLWF